jgi:hypothetical protein
VRRRSGRGQVKRKGFLDSYDNEDLKELDKSLFMRKGRRLGKVVVFPATTSGEMESAIVSKAARTIERKSAAAPPLLLTENVLCGVKGKDGFDVINGIGKEPAAKKRRGVKKQSSVEMPEPPQGVLLAAVAAAEEAHKSGANGETRVGRSAARGKTRRGDMKSADAYSSNAVEAKPMLVISNLLYCIQQSSICADKARELLCFAPPVLHSASMGMVALGFYYADDKRKIGLNKKWKGGKLRHDKIQASILVWVKYFALSTADEEQFVTMVIGFLLSCWLRE